MLKIFPQNKIKAILSIIVIILIGLGLIWFYWPIKIYLIESKTNTPLVNYYVEVIYEPQCLESGTCIQDVVYSGNTKNDGSINLPLNHAVSINKEIRGFMPKYEYWIKTKSYERDLKAKFTPEATYIIYLTKKAEL